MGGVIDKIFIDPTLIPTDFGGFCQCLFLIMAYGYILMQSSTLISDGSELLLLVPSMAGVVGSLVLPVLGAVPDGAIVLFSGLGGTAAQAQVDLGVGVGALAGSTVMLITIPWALSIWGGRVNIVNGQGTYIRPKGTPASEWSKLSPPGNRNLFKTGVTVGPEIAFAGKMMLATAATYIVIQAPTFALLCADVRSKHCHSAGEKYYILAGLLCCIVFFIAYLVYSLVSARKEQPDNVAERTDKVRTKAIQSKIASLSAVFTAASSDGKDLASPLIGNSNTDRIKKVMLPFFKKYDVDHDGVLDIKELRTLLKDLNEDQSLAPELMEEIDTNKTGTIDFGEFVEAMGKIISMGGAPKLNRIPSAVLIEKGITREEAERQMEVEEDEPEDEEEEEVPEDLAGLTLEQQQFRIKIRSLWMMSLGLVITLVVSDPMVGVLSQLGTIIGVKPFYVSFVLAPLASNAMEVISSFNYASKKVQKSINISLSSLLGAGIMNNTFALAIFLALIFFRDLAWEFSAETISILFVEVCVMIMAFKRTHRLFDGFLVLSLYPISLALVAILENVVGFN